MDIFTDPSVLAHLNPSAAKEVPTDTTSHGIGAVLTQQLQGIHCLMAFCRRRSKVTSSQNTSVELLSGTLRYFNHICMAGTSDIKVRHALCWLASPWDASVAGRYVCLSRHSVDPSDTVGDEPEGSVLSLSDFVNTATEQHRDRSLGAIGPSSLCPRPSPTGVCPSQWHLKQLKFLP